MKASKLFWKHDEDNRKFLDWARGKHENDGEGFADKLVKALSEEFKLHPPLSEDDRARLYGQVRLRLQSEQHARVREFAHVRIRA